MENVWIAYLIAATAGFFASAINAVAGGGTLISFPTLMALGLPERSANATNAVALWPGSISGAVGLHRYFGETKSQLIALLPPTILGAIGGSVLLVATPEAAFKAVVPFLIFLATLILAGQTRIKRMATERAFELSSVQIGVLQFGVALYGGYFGAGMGIMMLAIMSLYGRNLNINHLNVLKNWLAVIINFGASVILLSRGLVELDFGLAIMIGGLFGGYCSATISQRVNPDHLRKAIVVYGFAMSFYTAWRFWA